MRAMMMRIRRTTPTTAPRTIFEEARGTSAGIGALTEGKPALLERAAFICVEEELTVGTWVEELRRAGKEPELFFRSSSLNFSIRT
jgi:hypothetical protein